MYIYIYILCGLQTSALSLNLGARFRKDGLENLGTMYIYIYIYIYTYILMYVYVYTYIYIYMEREREI